MWRKGKFIVLEGTDGSGKATQFNKLIARLEKEKYDVATFDFPQYTKPSSYFVKEYLNGRYGSITEVGPYRASIFYALDRFDVSREIKKWLLEDKIVVSNRYTSSNMGHQGAKIKDIKERKEYFKWIDQLEHELLGIPRPDKIVLLRMPAIMAQKLIDQKGAREYVGGVKRDLHEADLEHLKRAEQTYLGMATLFPKQCEVVECVEDGRLLSVPEIQEKVWGVVKRLL